MNLLLETSLKSLKSKLSRVPAYERNGAYQIAARHVKLGLFILPKNEEAAQEHFRLATDAASRTGSAVLSTIRAGV